MEVVGAVSGIAGLLSLGGQVFSGAIKLIEAIEDMKDRDDQARHLKEEVSDLASVSIRLSLNVQSLRADSDFIESDFKMLEENIQSHLVDCDVDLRRWGTILKKHYSTPLTRMQKLSEMFRKDDRRELRAINRLLGEWRSKLSLDINELNSLFSSSGWRKLDKAHETMLNSHYELTEIHKAMLATANMDSKTSFRKLSEHFLRFEDDRIEKENAFYAKISTEVMEIKSYVSSIDTSLRSSLRKGSIWTRFVRSDTKSDSYDGSTFREQDQSASQNTFDTKSVSHYGGTFKEKDQSASRQPKGVKVLRADGISKSAIWSCGEALGIDDYFVETETRDKISCLLCMEEIDTDAGYEQARHLVESHQFNECDPGHYFTRPGCFRALPRQTRFWWLRKEMESL
ncbi:hypothetical protein CCHR01_09752 [Colletotrichum chrysophilum]|uniref:Fungal N-terminal domain-containing protein n=1 Tax=Colletotrichum chrysophilum TaxID=1836956 RepID=A0AAD9AIN6_9PEZI|nr:hypothetical protein CCHR01_09752 [Colletotrichum chrysophilum]